MRVDIAGLRGSVFAAIGLAHLSGCGGLVVFVDDGSDGSGGGGEPTPTSTGPSATTSATTGSGTPSACEDPAVLVSSDGVATGFVRCADGSIDRAARGGPCDAIGPSVCRTDADCGTPNLVCVCGGMLPNLPGSVCAPRSCDTDADCPLGECGVGTYQDGCARQTFLACRTSDDACRTDADCTRAGTPGECAPLSATSSFACQVPNCDIGRPLVVDGRVRTARSEVRTDWASDYRHLTSSVDPSMHAAIASRYAEIAALEHASVASFARFVLQLLAAGAPAELLAEAQRAGLDEIRHAELAYGVATAFAGVPTGPGPLPEATAAIVTDRRAMIEALVTEACVGETLGAAEARLSADSVEDPALRRALDGVADDEQRHAELGWRALAWLLRADPTLVPAARAAFEREARPERFAVVEGQASAPGSGLPSPNAIAATRRAVLEHVVGPCAQALLGARGENG